MNEKLLETMEAMGMSNEEMRELEIKMITLQDTLEEELQVEDQEFEEISFDELLEQETEI